MSEAVDLFRAVALAASLTVVGMMGAAAFGLLVKGEVERLLNILAKGEAVVVKGVLATAVGVVAAPTGALPNVKLAKGEGAAAGVVDDVVELAVGFVVSFVVFDGFVAKFKPPNNDFEAAAVVVVDEELTLLLAAPNGD